MNVNVYEEIKTAMEITSKLESLKRYVDDEADGLSCRVSNEDTYSGTVKAASELITVNKVKEVIRVIQSDGFRKESDKTNMELLMRTIR